MNIFLPVSSRVAYGVAEFAIKKLISREDFGRNFWIITLCFFSYVLYYFIHIIEFSRSVYSVNFL